jgi:hypothetical protein
VFTSKVAKQLAQKAAGIAQVTQEAPGVKVIKPLNGTAARPVQGPPATPPTIGQSSSSPQLLAQAPTAMPSTTLSPDLTRLFVNGSPDKVRCADGCEHWRLSCSQDYNHQQQNINPQPQINNPQQQNNYNNVNAPVAGTAAN